MHRVDAVVLWLLFGGGTFLAAGSVLSSIKLSMSAPSGRPDYAPAAAPRDLLPETEPESEAIPHAELLALPQPQSEPVQAGEPPPLPTDTSRTGKNKKAGRTESGKRRQGKKRREARNPQRRKNRN